MIDKVIEYPSSWEVMPLGKFVHYEKGKKPKKLCENNLAECDIPYIDIQAFEKGIIDKYTDGEKCRLCYENDILIVWDGSRSGLVGKGMDGALGSTLARLNFKGLDNNYAFYFLLSKYPEVNSRSKGAATPHVDPELLWGYDFPIPPLLEQQRIVEKIETLFSELDNGSESLKAAKAQLQLYRKSVLKSAFEGNLTKQWREVNAGKLESAESLLERIKKSQNNWIEQEIEHNSEAKRLKTKLKKLSNIRSNTNLPLQWLWVNLLEGCNQVVDCHNKTAPYTDKGIYLVRTSNIRNGKINLKDIKFVNQDTYEYWSRRCPPKANDIFFTREAPMGEAAIVPKDMRVCMGQRMMLLRVFREHLLEQYLLYAIMEPLFQHRITENAVGTGVKHLRVGDVEKLLFPLCSLAEQHQIVNEIESRFSEADMLEKTIDESLKKAEHLRQSILNKAFEGKLVPQYENDEPASELLNRIRQGEEEMNES